MPRGHYKRGDMQGAETSDLLRTFSPLRLAGPIFDKELRVASRRRRCYAIRTGYLVLLSLALLSAWYSIMLLQSGGVAALGMSRNAFLAMNVTFRIIYFQFIAAQLFAAVTLSGSISGEIQSGSLGVLLATPITSFQIVIGKLLSGLLQIVLLLAISFPALAAVRVMGGVPWDALWAGLAVTLVAAAFCGALCLWLSTYGGHPYQVVSAGTVVYLAVFTALPAFITVAGSVLAPIAPWVPSVRDLIDPRRALSAVMNALLNPGRAGTGYSAWPIHCAIMLTTTTVLLGLSVRRIRRRLRAGGGLKSAWFKPAEPLRAPTWKRTPRRTSALSKADKVAILAALGTCGLTVWAAATQPRGYDSCLNDISWVFCTIALLQMAVLAAGGITRDKESGAWLLLLTTPLDEKQILRGKASAALRRGSPLMLAALAVSTCFVFFVASSPKVLIAACYALSFLASAFFVLAAGLYFGVRLKTTTAAVGATIGLYLFVNYFVGGYYNPLYAWLRSAIIRSSSRAGIYLFVILGVSLIAVVLDVVVGVILIRCARRRVRTAVF
jgi:ABC-type transport system involved in multi-copper enzyme maturation permease subunit